MRKPRLFSASGATTSRDSSVRCQFLIPHALQIDAPNDCFDASMISDEPLLPSQTVRSNLDSFQDAGRMGRKERRGV